jgi:hypothetical protein
MSSRSPLAKRWKGVRELWAARISHGLSCAGWRRRMRQAKSCASATASASAGDCAVSRANKWSSSSVYRSGERRYADCCRPGAQLHPESNPTDDTSIPADQVFAFVSVSFLATTRERVSGTSRSANPAKNDQIINFAKSEADSGPVCTKNWTKEMPVRWV